MPRTADDQRHQDAVESAARDVEQSGDSGWQR